MAVYFCPEFIRDLTQHGDANFARRVLEKVITPDGAFVPDADDHRFHGAEGAWIRYVSRQTTAYRAIFIRRGTDIYWYRAGGHSIEDRFRTPRDLAVAAEAGKAPVGLDALTEYRNPHYTKSTHPRYLREVLATRILVAHRNVVLISPTISTNLAAPDGLVGQLINSVIEYEGTVTMITRPPAHRNLSQYRWLAARGVDLLVHQHVNARLFYFEVNSERIHPDLSHHKSIALIGSAELTPKGLNTGLVGEEPDEELCYEIAFDDLDGSYEFVLHLTDRALDLETYVATNVLR
jgi:hypothetical protein